MSHRATNWAIQQRGLKPATKIVLWHLCDRFNPDYGCFPSQDRLAHDCEISRAGLNSHLTLLERHGLLRRERRTDPVTKRQMSTRYILAFEEDFAAPPPAGPDGGTAGPGGETPSVATLTAEKPCPDSGHGTDAGNSSSDNTLRDGSAADPCPDSGHGAVSRKPADPCPENRPGRVQNLDTNLVREPLREPVKEEEDAQAREDEFEEFFAELLGALGFSPEATLPAWWQGWPARTHVRRWRDDLGLSEARIIAVAQESRQEHPAPPDGPRALDRFMERAARRDALAAEQQARGGRGAAGAGKGPGQRRQGTPLPRPSAGSIAEFYAGLVNSDRYLPASTISNTIRDEMLARGLVTLERLRMRGVR